MLHPGPDTGSSSRWLALAFACGLIFVADLMTIENHVTLAADRGVDLSLHRAFGRPFYHAFTVATTAGDTTVRLAVIGLLVLGLVIARFWWSAAFAVSATSGAALLGVLVKQAVHRARPHLFPHGVPANGFSFPSGHALDTCTLALVALYLVWHLWGGPRRIVAAGLVLLSYALLVGLSRIVLGVHYPSDVIGGYALASAWVASMIAFFKPAFAAESTRVVLRRTGRLDR